MAAAVTRLRKTFRYPTDDAHFSGEDDDDDDDIGEDLDEEEQEKLIANLRAQNQARNKFYINAFILLALICLPTYVPGLFSPLTAPSSRPRPHAHAQSQSPLAPTSPTPPPPQTPATQQYEPAPSLRFLLSALSITSLLATAYTLRYLTPSLSPSPSSSSSSLSSTAAPTKTTTANPKGPPRPPKAREILRQGGHNYGYGYGHGVDHGVDMPAPSALPSNAKATGPLQHYLPQLNRVICAVLALPSLRPSAAVSGVWYKFLIPGLIHTMTSLAVRLIRSSNADVDGLEGLKYAYKGA
ncbi:MAG: hypothetical protein M1819_002034 [Sarea resinae]|nr:MAG: hypothetical protein M1819_002034 [Sarea resinae]